MANPNGHKAFSVSSRGIAMTITAAALLFLGISRGELMATLCGVFLSSFLLYSFSLAGIARLLWGKSTTSFGWKHGSPKGFECSVQLRGRSRMAQSLARFVFEIDYQAGENLPFYLCIDLEGLNTTAFPALPPRGNYEGGDPHLRITDYPEFFSFRVPQNGGTVPERLIVIPEPYPVPLPFFPGGKTGIVRGKGVFNRSEDLFDARPYQLGDDPRKINWKLFAHTGKLAVRQGDLLPPPSSEILILINCYIRSPNQRSVREAFDSLIARVAYIAEALLSERRIVSLRFNGHTGEPITVSLDPTDPASPHRLYTYLADVTLTSSVTAESMIRAARPSGIATVFASLPTLALPDARALSEEGIQLALIGPADIVADCVNAASFIRELLFVPDRLGQRGLKVLNGSRPFSFPETHALLAKEGVHAEEI